MSEVICPLHEASQISCHEPAILSPERNLIYSEFDDRASWVAWHLYRHGVRSGDRVALYLAQDWRYPLLLMGVLRAGAVACLISTRQPREAVIRQLTSIRCSTVIALLRDPDQAIQDGLDVLHPETLLTAPVEPLPRVAQRFFSLDQPATILFTSGSSGTPKAVLHTFGNHYYNARGSNYNLRIRSHDRWLVNLPLYHVGGLGILFRCLLSGAGMILPHHDESIEEAQCAYGATHLSVVPTQLKRLLAVPELPASFSKVKVMLVGGSPIDQPSLGDALRRKWPVFTTYGLTEMASQVTTMHPGAPPSRRATSGTPLKYRDIGVTEEGEILVRGPCLFAGYVEGDEVIPAVDETGWFHTGDVGSVDAEGYLTVTGRRDNMFISGGENIYPEAIEQVLASVPGVGRAVVASIPDDDFGRRPVAFLAGDPLPMEAVQAALEKALPRFMHPVAFHPWPEGEEWNEDKVARDPWQLLAEALYHANR